MKKKSIYRVEVMVLSVFLLTTSYLYSSDYSWKENVASGLRKWTSVFSTKSGTRLLGSISNGYIYSSYNSGYSWSALQNAGSRNWQGVAASYHGDQIAACAYNEYICYSNDYGLTWTEQKNLGRKNWSSITSSSNYCTSYYNSYYNNAYYNNYYNTNYGNINCSYAVFAGCVDGGYIYTSNDSCKSWIERKSAGLRDWRSITSSMDGRRMAACAVNSRIITSSDSGNTWTEQGDSKTLGWRAITSSADGSKLAACADNEYIYTSTDYGVTWTERVDAGLRAWKSISLSNDGRQIAACASGDKIYISSDYGDTWTEQTDAEKTDWSSVAFSAVGNKIYACAYDGYVYTGINPSSKWYFSEGCTRSGFDTYLLVQNPNTSCVSIKITLMDQYGNQKTFSDTICGLRRVTYHVNDCMSDRDISAIVECTNSLGIVAERSMYWSGGGGHNSIGVKKTSKTWFLAEGSTSNGFDTWILVQNPHSSDALLKITYMDEFGMTEEEAVTVKSHSRFTRNIGKHVLGMNNKNGVSTAIEVLDGEGVISERSMYWLLGGGHNTMGVTATSKKWFLAEGSTANGFDTWILVQNPYSSDALIKIAYMDEFGRTEEETVTVKSHSRFTRNIGKQVSSMNNKNGVSTTIEVLDGEGVISERSMYWPAGGGHNVVGSTSTSQKWYLAEGSTLYGFQTWLLILNPYESRDKVQITYMSEKGSIKIETVTIEPKSRCTINVNNKIPNTGGVSITVDCTEGKGVVVERSMYWNGERVSDGTCGLGAIG